MADKLKPCPFCGGEAKIDAEWDRDVEDYRVECTKCDAWTGLHPDRTRAVAAWNRRATEDELLEALADLADEASNFADMHQDTRRRLKDDLPDQPKVCQMSMDAEIERATTLVARIRTAAEEGRCPTRSRKPEN